MTGDRVEATGTGLAVDAWWPATGAAVVVVADAGHARGGRR